VLQYILTTYFCIDYIIALYPAHQCPGSCDFGHRVKKFGHPHSRTMYMPTKLLFPYLPVEWHWVTKTSPQCFSKFASMTLIPQLEDHVQDAGEKSKEYLALNVFIVCTSIYFKMTTFNECCLWKEIISRQRIRHFKILVEYIFRLRCRHHQLLFK